MYTTYLSDTAFLILEVFTKIYINPGLIAPQRNNTIIRGRTLRYLMVRCNKPEERVKIK